MKNKRKDSKLSYIQKFGNMLYSDSAKIKSFVFHDKTTYQTSNPDYPKA